MKKIFLSVFFTFLLFGLQPLFADRYLVEGKVGYFRPYSKVLRKLYTRGWADYQFEFSYSPFDSRDQGRWKNFFAWGAFNHIYNHGQTKTGIDDSEIHVRLYNYSAGLKYLLPLPGHFGVYGSAGGRYIFLRIKNEDPNVEPHDEADGWGSVFSFGFLYNPYKCLLVDFFTNIMIRNFSKSNFENGGDVEPKGIDVGGVTLGLGVGFCF